MNPAFARRQRHFARRRATAWLAPALLMAALAWAPGCRKVPVETANANGEKPSFLFQGFAARASHDGALVWEAHAVRARVFDKEQRALGEDVTLLYFLHGKPVSTARAKSAKMDLKRYDVEAEGDVEVHGMNGVILQTQRLNWDNKAQRASSSARVRVIRGGAVLTGKGFSADRDLHDVRILEDVQAEAVSVQQLRKEAGQWRAP
jgi:LPS export ABC transporter protein LptC